jgi:hypothetical protein
MKGKDKGFTIVEVVTASVILVITVLALFYGIVIVAKLNVRFRNRADAGSEALRWLQDSRGMLEYDDTNLICTSSTALASNPWLGEDPGSWELADRVNNLTATYAIDGAEDLGSGTLFKKVVIDVTWDEKSQ